MNALTIPASRRRVKVVNSSYRAVAMHAISAAFSWQNFSQIVCRLKKSAYICNALHLKQATKSPTATAAGFFYGRGLCHNNTSSVPCGALMRPLPVSRCNATGSGTFFCIPPCRELQYFSFHLKALQK